MRVLDSHLHLWDPAVLDYSWLDGALHGRFAAAELRDAGVRDTTEQEAVFIQADCVPGQELDEVRWVAADAGRTGVRGIVAGGRLDRREDTRAHLAALAECELVVGVRHLLQGEEEGLAVSSEFVAGARELASRKWVFDACVRGTRQLSDVAGLASQVPELRIVLDHLGKPAVGTAGAPLTPAQDWVDGLADLARHPRVWCKLSGLPAEADGDWSESQAEPFLDAAAAAFGAERLMWGSDWPVSAVAPGAQYRQAERARWAAAVEAWAIDRGHDVGAIMYHNAAECYRLV